MVIRGADDVYSSKGLQNQIFTSCYDNYPCFLGFATSANTMCHLF